MQCWLANSFTRYYPASPAEERPTLTLEAARGERVAFQVLCRTEERRETPCLTATVSADDALDVTIRRIGYVPMPRFNTQVPLEELDGVGFLPGFVPDPLFPNEPFQMGSYETRGYWVTIRIPAEAQPGTYPIAVTLDPGGASVTLTAMLEVHPAVVPMRQGLPVTHWFYADALLDWYRLRPFEERFWTILNPYLADMVEHGLDTLYVPFLTPPTDGIKRPTQLLHVRREGEGYRFDWTMVKRWIEAGNAHGFRHFEWTHLFTQGGVRFADRVYRGHGEDEVLFWPLDTPATSPIYRQFLAQLLPELKRFLDAEGLLERSFFHLSDEPQGAEQLENYRAARHILRELAPWMKVMDALSETSFAKEGLSDMPIPTIDHEEAFRKEGIPHWTYFCCGPRHWCINRLLDTPLVKIRMLGWAMYRTRVLGFLHWGHNYWYKMGARELIDPYTVTDGLEWPVIPYGDTFVVYPGPDGPVDSIRWEAFAAGLQDYALLQAAGVDPDGSMLAEVIDYTAFPRDPEWMLARRREALRLLDAK